MITVFENTIALKDLEVGKYATSPDRKKVWVAGYHYHKETSQNLKVILGLDRLTDQYSDNWDMNQKVIVLKEGDVIQWNQK